MMENYTLRAGIQRPATPERKFWRSDTNADRQFTKRLMLFAAFMIFCLTPAFAQVAVTATGGTTSSSYATLGAAFTAINSGSHTGSIVIEISGNTTETGACVLNSSAAGSASYSSVVIRPTVDGVTISGPTVTGRGLIELNGADNVTIDGDNPNTGGTNRNLTITNTAATTVLYTMAIRIAIDGTTATTADNITIKNCIVNGNATGRNTSSFTSTTAVENVSYGIYAGNRNVTTAGTNAPGAISSTGTTIGAGTYSNLIIDNNAVNAAGRAIAVQGSVATIATGLQITNNVIGASTTGAATNVYSMGITASGSSNGIISGNTILNVESYVGTGLRGISVDDITAVTADAFTIERNTISNVISRSTGAYAAYGINIIGGTGHLVRNNFVYGLNSVQGNSTTGTTFGVRGIRVSGGTNHKIYYNSVYLTGAMLGTSTDASVALSITSTSYTGIDVRNNIFANTQTGSTGSQIMGIQLPSGGSSTFNLTLNNNAIFTGTASNNSLLGLTSGTYYTVANFVSGSTTGATNARTYTSTLSAAGTNDNATLGFTSAVPFTSATNLHIPAGTTTRLESGGVTVSGTTTDIDGESRPGPAGSANGGATAPDMGADEFDGTPAQPCTTPSAATAVASSAPTATSLSGTITAPATAPSGYLVVYSTSSTLSAGPVDGTQYAAGTSLGGGTVGAVGSSTSFTISSLTSNTGYYIFVYSYNSGVCLGGPLYSTTSVTTTGATCAAAATALASGSITNTSATITWTAAAAGGSYGAITYTLQVYSDSGYTTLLNSYSGVSSGYTLTGLTGNTTYYYRVVSSNGSCGTNAQSSFTTMLVSPVTWTEGFTTTTLPTGWTNSGFTIGSTRGATGNPGNNIYKNLWASATSGNFTTVTVGALGANDRLTFDYKTSNYSSPYGAPGAGAGTITIEISTNYGTSYSSFATISVGASNTWQSVAYPLASYSGQNVKFRFTGTWTSGDYDLAFDNFSVAPTPSCIAPGAGSASGISTVAATVSWPAVTPTPEVGYEYVNSTTNTAPTGSGTATTSASVSLTGLTSSTTYYLWVRSVCSGSNSAWTMVASYSTLTPGQIGTGTATSTTLPIYTCYGYNYSQQIYLASELTAILNPGETYITKIRFKYGSGAATPATFANWTVYFGNTSQSVFSSTTNWVPFSALTQVYSGDITFTNDTWVEIVLATPFAWDGTSNLVVAVDENTPDYSCTATWGSYTASSNRGMIYYNDTTNPDPASPPTANSGPTSALAQLQLTTTTPPTCLPPTGIVASDITPTSANVTWTAPATGTTPIEYSWELRSSGAAGSGLTGLVTRGTETTNHVAISSLSPNTTYSFYVRSNCDASTSSIWTQAYTITTLQNPGSMPFNDDFEGASNWVYANGTATNKWVVGTATNNGGTHALYVSNDNGTSNAYTTTASSIVHAYRDITVPAGTTTATLSFDYKANGEEDFDYLRVRILPVTTTPVAGTQLTTGTQIGGDIVLISSWTNYTNTALDLTAFAGQTIRLAFEWTNDGSAGSQPPGAIDNVLLLVPTCYVPTALTSSAIGTTTATISWTAPTPAPGVGYDYYLSTTNVAPLTSTTPTGTTATTSASLTGLTSPATYYWWARSNCGSGNGTSLWTPGGSFTTEQIPATTPFTDNFEGSLQWSFINGNQTNQWYLGTAVANGGTHSLYVSNTNGTTNNYDTGITSIVHAYRDITIPVGTTVGSLSFDWRGYGEGSTTYYDYLRVRIIPVTTTPVAGTQLTAGTQIGSNLNLQSTWQSYTNASLNLSAYAGQTIRLVFEWTNDDSAGTQPPGAIDNVSLIIPTCFVPSAPSSSAITTTTATISWTAASPAPSNGYDYYVSTSSTAPTSGTTATGTVASGLSAALTGLSSGTTYYYWVRSNCGGGDTSAWVGSTFTTVCAPITSLPWTENFDSMTTLGSTILPNCWTNDVPGTNNYTSANAGSNTYNDPRSTPNYVTIYYPSNNNSFMWTPGFNLTAGVSYTFSFYYVGDNTSGWVGQVYQNTTPSRATATQLGGNFLDSGTTTSNATYTLVTREFVPTTTGTYYFAVASNAVTFAPYYLGYDDFSVALTPSGITGFTPTDVCSEGGQTVTISGTNLTGTSSVTFNGVAAASFAVVNSGTVTAVTPAGVTAGAISLTTPLNATTSSTSYTVTANPTVADITGATSICTDTPVTLSSATAGGVWSSTNTAVASVDAATGLVTGHEAGTATIVYTVTTNGCSSSKSTTVTVYEAPSIASVTSTQAVTPGSTATYTVSATGSGLTYQWQVNTGSGWTSLTDDSTYAGSATATLTISNATLSMDGYTYQVIVTGTSPCTSTTSSPASTLYVSLVGITANPVSVTNCSTNQDASFSVTATGTSLSYQWQESTNGGSTWTNITNGTTGGLTYAGATTATLSLSHITTASSGYQYKVIVTDSGSNSATSTEATLTVYEAVVLTSQPTAQYVCTGTSVSKNFTVGYTGTATIQWEYSANGSTWASVANATPTGITYTGATTGTLTVTSSAAAAAGTYYYRAVFTAEAPCSNTTSDAATLTIGLPTIAISGSSSTYCAPGTGVTLTASGATSYSWSPATGLSATSGASVVATPSVTTTYTVTGTDANGCNGTATFTVTVSATPTATATAAASEVCTGSTVQLDVNAATAFTTPAINTYQFTNTTGTYANLSAGATAVSILADSSISAALPIGFTFNYGGTDYTQFKMSSNGFISLNTTGTNSLTANDLSTANASSRPIIAPLWDDLDGRPTGATAFAGYEVTGTAPNRVLTAEWRNWEWNYNAGAAVISFQAKLYEGTNNIEFVYRSETAAVTSGSATIGIGAPSGSGSGSYLNVTSISSPAVSSTTSVTNLSTKPATGTVYRFSPGNAPALTYSWTSSPAGFTSSVKNPVATVNANTTYTVVVTSAAGCTTSSSVTVNATSGGSITTQPTGSTLCQGSNFTLTVVATGPGLTYQWRKGGVDISGATSATYSVTAATPTNSGDYDVVITPACGSAITSNPATVLVNPTPTATAPANVVVCAGSTISAITLAGTPSGVTFNVSGGSAIGLSNLTGVTTIPAFTPSTYGTATITVTPTANGCTGTAVTFTITVNPTPAAVSVSASSTSLCNGAVATLTATGGTTPVINVTGTGTATNSATSYPAPYSNYWGGTKHQMLIRASELTAMGYVAGSSITSIGFTINSVGTTFTGSLQGFSINVGHTTATALTGTSFVSGLTTVFPAATVTIPTTGLPQVTNHVFTTPFVWDGTSNLVIQTSYSNGNSGASTDTVQTRYTTTSYTSTNYYTADSTTPAAILSAATPTSSSSSRPNITITATNPGSFVWSPTTGLYTDAAATVAYTGTATATVYAAPTANTTYTASVTTAAGCSASNTVTINSASASAPASGDQQFCPGATVANLTATGTNLQWYTAATGGTALSSSTALVSAPYYVSQTVNGCESNRTAIVVTVQNTWTGAVNSSWTTAGNWCDNIIPTIAMDVVIPETAIQPVLTAGNIGYAHNLTVASGASLTVKTGATLSVENILAVNPFAAELIVEDNGALIQGAATVTDANSGNIIITKKSNELYRLDYTMWSSPVAEQNLLDFSPATTVTRFYTYNPASNAYATITPDDHDFETARGYLIRMPNIDPTAGYMDGTESIVVDGTFYGAPHNGTILKDLSTAGTGYNAVGNPYPSPINLSDFFAGNSSVINTSSGIYLWRKRNNGANSSYATLTLAAFTANPAEGGGSENDAFYTGNSDNWTIAPAQGFIVKTAATTGTPQLTFTNTMRRPTPGITQSFFRTGADTASRFWVNLAGTGTVSQTAVAYMENATLDLDYGYDGNRFIDNANTVAFYSLAQNKALAVQARPTFANSDIVPMGYLAPTAGTYTISIDHVDGVFAQGQTIFLRDNLNGMIANLTEGSYTFVTEAGTFNTRFEILYNTEALGTDVPTIDANNVVVFKQGNTIQVNTGSVLMNGVTIYDIRGRKVYSMSDINNTQTAISNLTAEQQVLIVEIDTVKGKVSKRIVF